MAICCLSKSASLASFAADRPILDLSIWRWLYMPMPPETPSPIAPRIDGFFDAIRPSPIYSKGLSSAPFNAPRKPPPLDGASVDGSPPPVWAGAAALSAGVGVTGLLAGVGVTVTGRRDFPAPSALGCASEAPTFIKSDAAAASSGKLPEMGGPE